MSHEELDSGFEPAGKPIEYSDLDGAQIKGPNPLDDVVIHYEERVTYDGVEMVPIRSIKPYPTTAERATELVNQVDAFVRSLPVKRSQ